MQQVSADNMMINARGPVWHQQQQPQGLVPKGRRGLDQQASGGKSRADGWIYGHGTFSLTPPQLPIVGLLPWRSNAGHEANRMAPEVITSEGMIKTSFMDSKADDQALDFGLKQNSRSQLVPVPRKGLETSASRPRLIKHMLTKQHTQDDQERSTTVEPMQGLVADIFALERCWMRGEVNNRWLFAAMDVAGQMAQWTAWKHKRSTGNVQSDVLGV